MSHYKHSSWLDGLIEAERLYKEGWIFEYQDGLRIQFRYKSMDGPTMAFFSSRLAINQTHQEQDEFHKGCTDYVKYYVEHLDGITAWRVFLGKLRGLWMWLLKKGIIIDPLLFYNKPLIGLFLLC